MNFGVKGREEGEYFYSMTKIKIKNKWNMLKVQLQTYHFIEYRRKVIVLNNKRIGHIWNLKKHLTRVKSISAKLLIHTKM